MFPKTAQSAIVLLCLFLLVASGVPLNLSSFSSSNLHPFAQLPDLAIEQNITFFPSQPIADETVTLTTTIHNLGTADAKDVSVSLYEDSTLIATRLVDVMLNYSWEITTVDSTGAVGEFSALALDSNGNPHISYYDATNSNLRYVKRQAGGWVYQTVDTADNVGLCTSIALDTNNNPHISYYDATNSDLKYAAWSGSSWHIQTVDASGLVGTSTSITLDANSRPHISYYDATNGDLKYAYWNGWNWVKQAVDSAGDVGRYTDIVLASNGYPHISYYDADNGDLKYAKWTGSAWYTQTVDSAGDVGWYTSLALDSHGYPYISYYDRSNGCLKYAVWNGSTWHNETVDTAGDVGWYNSLTLDSFDRPHISYYSQTTGELKYAKWTERRWDIRVVDSYGDAGAYAMLALDSSGLAHISYYDITNQDLKYARLLSVGTGSLQLSMIWRPRTAGMKNITLKLDELNMIEELNETNNNVSVSVNVIARPGPPQNLRATGGNRIIKLIWSAPGSDGGAPITNYRLYRGLRAGTETFLIEIGNVLNYTDTGLTNGQTYYYVLSAKNAAGEGALSTEVYAIPATVPAAPRNLRAISGKGEVLLQWLEPATDGGQPVTNYILYRGTAPARKTFLVKLENVLNYTDTNFSDRQSYYFYVVSATNIVGESEWSNEASAVPAVAPSAPLNLRAEVGSGVVVLSWSPPISDGGLPVTNYRVYRGTSSAGKAFLAELGNVTTCTDTGLINGVTYYYAVSARNYIGEGTQSHEVSATPSLGVDRTRPSVTISTPADNATLNLTLVTVRGTASDNIMVERVEVSIDNVHWLLCNGTSSWSLTLRLAIGRNTIYAKAIDTSGNWNITSITVTVHIPDVMKPTVSITYPVSGTVLNTTTLTIIGTAWDNVMVQKVEVSTDGTNWSICNGTVSWYANLSLVAGQNTIYVRATDAAGNYEIISIMVTVELADSLSPNIQILSPRDGAILESTLVMIVGIASDNREVVKVELSTDRINWILCNGTTRWYGNITLGVGQNLTIYARATDSANNSMTVSINVTVRPKKLVTEPAWWEIAAIAVALSIAIVFYVLVVAEFLGFKIPILKRLRKHRDKE